MFSPARCGHSAKMSLTAPRNLSWCAVVRKEASPRIHLQDATCQAFFFLPDTLSRCGCGSKLTRRGYADSGPCFHLPIGCHFGIPVFGATAMCLSFQTRLLCFATTAMMGLFLRVFLHHGGFSCAFPNQPETWYHQKKKEDKTHTHTHPTVFALCCKHIDQIPSFASRGCMLASLAISIREKQF